MENNFKPGDMFKIGDVVQAKEEYLYDDQTQESTMKIVIDYKPKNDYLLLGELDSKHVLTTRASFYELVKDGDAETRSFANDVVKTLPSEEETEKIISDLRNYILSIK